MDIFAQKNVSIAVNYTDETAVHIENNKISKAQKYH